MGAVYGKAGDVFRIEFQRASESEDDDKKVSWSYVRNEELSAAMVEQARRPQFFVCGSWDFNAQLHRMQFTGEYFQFYIELGNGKQEGFQVFENGNFGRCFCPSVANASPHVKHELMGPDAKSKGLCWTIGHHDADQAEPGKRYEVRLFVDEDMRPERLDWMPVRGIDGLEDARGRGFLVFGT